jgi:hypothetical protein
LIRYNKKEKMKKIVVVFGGLTEYYVQDMLIFKAIEKSFNCRIRRARSDKFITRLNDCNVEFRFCHEPLTEKNSSAKKYTLNGRQFDAPISSGELVKKINKANIILFCGFCGGFHGKPGETYLPESCKEIFFRDLIIKHKEILAIAPKNEVCFRNILLNKMKGKEGTIITSNVTLTHKHIEGESREHLIKIAEILAKEGDAIDKESYQIVNYFKNKVPLGLVLTVSDVLSINKHMIHDRSYKLNYAQFRKNCINAIKIALEQVS